MNEKQAAPENPSSTEMTLEDALLYALRLQQEGRVEGAAQLYARILEKAPDNVDALHFLGGGQVPIGRRGSGDGPDWSGYRAQARLCRCVQQSGQCAQTLNREAAQAYRRVIELDPENADVHNNLGALLRAEGKAAEDEEILRRALELEPRHADAFHNLGNVLVELKRDSEAADMYTQALRLRPYNAENYLQLARALYGLSASQRHWRSTSNGWRSNRTVARPSTWSLPPRGGQFRGVPRTPTSSMSLTGLRKASMRC